MLTWMRPRENPRLAKVILLRKPRLIFTINSILYCAEPVTVQEKVDAALSSPATPSKDEENNAENKNLKRTVSSDATSDVPPAKAIKC